MTPSRYLATAYGLSFREAQIRQIDGMVTKRSLPAGAIPLREGEQSAHVFLLEQGLVRGYYLGEGGNEVTKCFAREGECFSSEGLRTGAPSTFTVECLEPVRCLQLSYALLHRLMDEDPAISALVRGLYLRELARLEQRSKYLLLLGAGARYEAFCREEPELHRRAPQRHIASYLGMHPGSLSRIRSQTSGAVHKCE